MQNIIIPISHLKNYSKVIRNVKKNRPVYLTRNGIPRYIIMDLEDYEELVSCKNFLFDLMGDTFETNDSPDKEDFKNVDYISNKTANGFWESISNNADTDTKQNSESMQNAEPDNIRDIITIILNGLSVTYDALDRIVFDLYGVNIGAFKDNQKEHIWK